MNNTTAKELLDLARHYDQFHINSQEAELLKRAAKELEDFEKDDQLYQDFVAEVCYIAGKTTITDLDRAIEKLEEHGL